MLEKSVPEGLHSVERAHAGPVCEELQPVGKTYLGEVCLLWVEPLAGTGEEPGQEGAL